MDCVPTHSVWPSAGAFSTEVADRLPLAPGWFCTRKVPPVWRPSWSATARAYASTAQWIASLLPDDVLTPAADAWRAPTSWEIRHVVGENSFTGISGARAAALVGVTPQNFRKYTTADGAATRQTMSYAMWHLLMHRLGVQRAD